MKPILRLILAISCLTLLSFAFIEHSWRIPEGGKADFYIKGTFGEKVHGTLEFTRSEITFDPTDPSKAVMNVVLDVSSIKTGTGLRDKHLKKRGFFDESIYHYIVFESVKVDKMGDSTYAVLGDLTMKDVTRKVNIPFTFSQTSSGAVFKGEFTINRMDYHVGVRHKIIGKEVKIKLNVPVVPMK